MNNKVVDTGPWTGEKKNVGQKPNPRRKKRDIGKINPNLKRKTHRRGGKKDTR